MNIMNVNSALSAVQAADSANAISMEMLDKTLDMNQTMNDSLVKMMENSVMPHLGGNFDMSI